MQVKKNKGKGGIDGMQVDEFLSFLRENAPEPCTPCQTVAAALAGGFLRFAGIPGLVRIAYYGNFLV